MENLIKMDDLGVTLFLETPTCPKNSPPRVVHAWRTHNVWYVSVVSDFLGGKLPRDSLGGLVW